MKKIMLGTSDAWSMNPLSHRPSEPVYHIEDCRISRCGDFGDFTGASFSEYAFEVFTIVEFTTSVCIVSAGVPILSLPTAEIYTKNSSRVWEDTM